MIRLRSSTFWMNARTSWLLPAVGAAFCGFFILIPEVAAMLGAPPGRTWVPVSSQYQMMGDSYFYAAAVQEVREGFWHHSSPVSQEVGGIIAVDKFRGLAYRCLALGGLFLHDARYAFLLSYICFAVLNFLLVYRLAREVKLVPLAALATGLAVLFWLKAPYYLENVPYSRLADLWAHMRQNAFIGGDVDFELYNDNFRYAVLQMAICVLWGFLIALLRFDRAPSLRSAIPVVLLGVALVYSYYSLAVIGALVFAGYLLLSLLQRDFVRSRRMAGVAAGIIALGILLGVPADALAAISSPNPIVEVHVASVSWGGLTPVVDVLLRNLSVLPILLLVVSVCFRGPSTLSRLGLVCLFAVSVLVLSQMVPSTADITKRFIYRGFNHITTFLWMALFLHLLGCSEDDKPRPPGREAARTVLLGGVVVFLAVAPAVGDLKLARTLHRSEARRIPECQWASYEYLLETMAPNALVLALDWEDVLLLPVYTHVDLYFGDVSFTGRSQVEEVRRYLRSWFFLRYPPDLLRKRIEDSVRVEAAIGYPTPQRALEKASAEGVMLMWHLFYNPYVKKFDGLPIRTSSHDINPAFVDRVFALASPSESIDLARETSINSILLSRDYEQLRPTPFAPIPGFDLVVRNGCRTLYGRAKQ